VLLQLLRPKIGFRAKIQVDFVWHNVSAPLAFDYTATLTWRYYLFSCLPSSFGGGDCGFFGGGEEGLEFFLKLPPSTTKFGCGISSPGLLQPLFISFTVFVLRPVVTMLRYFRFS